MSEQPASVEERILQAVRRTIANVIRDTATPRGMRHPLSDATIEDLRQCIALVSARERELARAAGRPQLGRPGFTDAPADGEQVIRVHRRKPPAGGGGER